MGALWVPFNPERIYSHAPKVVSVEEWVRGLTPAEIAYWTDDPCTQYFLPPNFYDIVGDVLTAQPEPQYLFTKIGF